ncbi:MAG: Gfo/Idh/MocA family protein [Armatimonadota bacterium]
MLRLGVIGYGARAQGMISIIKNFDAGVEVTAITDVRNDQIAAQMREQGGNPDSVAFYTDADDMLENEKLDGVLVGTRCSLHATMAIKVLQRNLPLFLEKPVATNMDDLIRLRDAAARSQSEVVVSFPLRVTPLVRLAKEIIDSGKIGTVEQVQAWNNVGYGICYYMGWYRDENETQGLFLQKATHDFDYINYLLGIEPRWICAVASKQIYKGDRPAGLTCDKCNEWEECLESPYHLFFTRAEAAEVQEVVRPCAFAQDTGNEDSGSAIIEYETGMHACYTQNFFARRKAHARGARLLGYRGTIEFDWATEELNVFMHHAPRVETYRIDTTSMSHGGGDTVLVDNFIRVMRGEARSVAPLSAGVLSALMCLKAKESAATRTFQEIIFPDSKG